MRIWHKDLIPVLPRQQLLGQWRELCLIARNIYEKGTPNHILVNRVMDYPIGHLFRYAQMIYWEMDRRGYRCNWNKFENNFSYRLMHMPSDERLFEGWHNKEYLIQCYYNLEEKYFCGGISKEDFIKIWEVYHEALR